MFTRRKNSRPSDPVALAARWGAICFFCLAFIGPALFALVVVLAEWSEIRSSQRQFVERTVTEPISLSSPDNIAARAESYRQKVLYSATAAPLDFMLLPASDMDSSPSLALLYPASIELIESNGTSRTAQFEQTVGWSPYSAMGAFRHDGDWRFVAAADNPARLVCFDEQGSVQWQRELSTWSGLDATGQHFVRSAPDGTPLIFVVQDASPTTPSLVCYGANGELVAQVFRTTADKSGIEPFDFVWGPVPLGDKERALLASNAGIVQLLDLQSGEGTRVINRVEQAAMQSRYLYGGNEPYFLSKHLFTARSEHAGSLTGQQITFDEMAGEFSSSVEIDPSRHQQEFAYHSNRYLTYKNSISQWNPRLEVLDEKGNHIAIVQQILYSLYGGGPFESPESAYDLVLSFSDLCIFLNGSVHYLEYTDWPRNKTRVLAADDRIVRYDTFFLPHGAMLAIVTGNNKVVWYAYEVDSDAEPLP